MLYKKTVFKNFQEKFQYLQENSWSLLLESIFDKITALKTCNISNEKPQHKCFPMNIEKPFSNSFFKKNICERLRLYLTDFSEQLVFTEGVFQNSLTNIFISNFYWTLDVSQTASYEITLVRLLVFPSVCLSILLSISAILYKMMADHDM